MGMRMSLAEWQKICGEDRTKTEKIGEKRRKADLPVLPKLIPYAGFEIQCQVNGLPRPDREYLFHPTRKWRFDFCWPEAKVALEIDGGVWSKGRHTRGSGFIKDMEKLNEAAILGYRVIRCTPQQVKSNKIFTTLRRLFDSNLPVSS